MSSDIEHKINSCAECQVLRPSLPAAKPVLHNVSNRPMEDISADIFHHGSTNYLVVVDRFSGYPFVYHLPHMTTKAVTDILQSIFYEYGFPSSIMTDNGPQFRDTFKKFCNSHSIKCIHSSPYFPQSNGLAEAAVKNCKYLLMKCQGNFELFKKKLLELRATASSEGPSPAFLFYGREITTSCPRFTPTTSKELQYTPSFETGQKVRVQDINTRRWTDTGIIKSTENVGRSFKILLDKSGKTIWRNCKFIKPLNPSKTVRFATKPTTIYFNRIKPVSNSITK